ncbi:MAG TPA: DHHA1 domain-containing protein, partial [Planctomycetota bacterium]|nr:DHHA1 domain-containing protein [Planctomycetota bacterium]
AILVRALRELGARCDWYIPDRLGDGYGLTMAGVERLAARGTGLLLTADCGITCIEAVATAQAAGLEVIVTDHHEPGELIPDCPILHPRLSSYPCGELCATGVAYKLSAALLGGERAADDLDLVALATVADVAPLVGLNRALVRQGLAVMAARRRPGIAALAEVGRVRGALDAYALGFVLGPRVNAGGRVGAADLGARLLATADPHEAAALAARLDALNTARRDIEAAVLVAAEAQVRARGADGPLVWAAGEGWHPGVVGIVAARLAGEFHRPAVVVALDGETGRGSARTVNGFHLERALAACGSHLMAHGGHAAAAGIEVHRDRIDGFAAAFAREASTHMRDHDRRRKVALDAVVPLDHLDTALLRDLERLAPHGQGNPAPLLASADLRVAGKPRPMGKTGNHVSFVVRDASGASHRAVWFDGAARLEETLAADGGRLCLAYRPEADRWRGGGEIQLMVHDARPGAVAIDGDA